MQNYMNCAYWMLSNPKMPNCADTSSTQLPAAAAGFTIFFYTKSATFPSRIIFRIMQSVSTPSNKIGNSFFAPAASFGEANGGSYEEGIKNRQSHIAVLRLGCWFKRFVSIVPN